MSGALTFGLVALALAAILLAVIARLRLHYWTRRLEAAQARLALADAELIVERAAADLE